MIDIMLRTLQNMEELVECSPLRSRTLAAIPVVLSLLIDAGVAQLSSSVGELSGTMSGSPRDSALA